MLYRIVASLTFMAHFGLLGDSMVVEPGIVINWSQSDWIVLFVVNLYCGMTRGCHSLLSRSMHSIRILIVCHLLFV